MSFFSILFALLFHFGCFTFSPRRRGSSLSLLKKKPTPPKTTVFSYLKRLFYSSSSTATATATTHVPPPPPSIPSPSSSTRSLCLNPPLIAPVHSSLSTRIAPDIHPCAVCGEIFRSSAFLHQHQSTKHAVSELLADGERVVRIIFEMGWPEKAGGPTIHRILKIHNTPKVAGRFEDHRERVKSKAAAADRIENLGDERCAADGNELLRFYCTTFICALDSAVCGHQFCGACSIIRRGFSKKLDGIPTLPTSWKAHAAVPEDAIGFMHVKRAMLVCRVIAGRVGFDPNLPEKEGDGFDSVVGPERNGGFEDELLVFSHRAVLPCFVIIYTL